MPVVAERYHQFVSNLEIINITAPSVSWELLKAPPKNSELFHSTEINLLDPIIKGESNAVIGAKLVVTGKTKKAKKPFMTVNITLELSITVPPEFLTREILEAYAQRNASLTLVATFREHVKYATFQMGLRPLVLPALKILPPEHAQARQSKKRKAIKKST